MRFTRMNEITGTTSLAVLADGHQAIPTMVDRLNVEGIPIPCMRGKTAENILQEIWEALRIVSLLPGRLSLTVVDRFGTHAVMRHFHLDVGNRKKN